MADRPVVTVEVAALMLGEDPDTIRRMAEEGRLELVAAEDGSLDVCMESLNQLDAD